MPRPHVFYFVKRQPQPDYHRAPYHRYVICTLKHTADWEAGWTGAGSCVWVRTSDPGGQGWLWTRWNGFDIDYGHIVRPVHLPDGRDVAFVHPHTRKEPWSLLRLATWWSLHDLPKWLADLGVKRPTDEFTINRIQEDSGACLLSESKRNRLDAWREKYGV